MGRAVRAAVAVLAIAALGVAGLIAYHALRGTVSTLSAGRGCTATVDGRTVSLDPEQAQNAALIAAIAVGRGLPARAASIALATAYQESKIYNLDSGDRDSLGLFQQRPSQGWGTRAEVRDPVHATNAFYDALTKVSGYETMPITEAAQEVQRSGFPQAYVRHEADARVLASALTGNSAHAFSCTVLDEPSSGPTQVDEQGLTPRAAGISSEIGSIFGRTRWVAGDRGRTVHLAVGSPTTGGRVRGWAMAQYVVAQAGRLHVRSVTFAGLVWTAGHSGDGWRRSASPGPGLRVVTG